MARGRLDALRSVQVHIKSIKEDYVVITNANVVASFRQSFTFGGTSLLIVVGVVQETFRELEAQLTMRNYKGFL